MTNARLIIEFSYKDDRVSIEQIYSPEMFEALKWEIDCV